MLAPLFPAGTCSSRRIRRSLAPFVLLVTLGVAFPAGAFPALSLPALSLPAVDPPEVGVGFQPLAPARLFDSRPGAITVDGTHAGGGKVSASAGITIGGRGGLPDRASGAVVLNVTALDASDPTYLTAIGSAGPKPAASNLNVAPGQIAANVVVVPMAVVGISSGIGIANHAGSVHLVVDVLGWFPSGSGFEPVAMSRVADTRAGAVTADGRGAGTGSVGPGGAVEVDLAGRVGVPWAGATAVLVNVTGTDVSTTTYLTAHAGATAPGGTSTVNLEPGDTLGHLVVVPLSANGTLAVSNHTGAVHVVVDVVGFFDARSDYPALSPSRLVDTRSGTSTVDGLYAGDGPVSAGATYDVAVAGRGTVPPVGAGAAIVNITVPDPEAVTFVTAYPSGAARPNASSLNPVPGRVTTNLAVVPLGPDGHLELYNAAGRTDLVVDLYGWLPAPASGGSTPAGSWYPPAGRVPSSGTYAYLESSPGEPTASGTSRLFTRRTAGPITALRSGGPVWFRIPGERDWRGLISFGAVDLAPGVYQTAGGAGPLSMTWMLNRTCDAPTSWLAVDDVHRTGDVIDRLDLRFEQRCTGASGGLEPALRGRVVIDPTDTSGPPGPAPIPVSTWQPPAGAVPAGVTGAYVDSPVDTTGAGFVGFIPGTGSTGTDPSGNWVDVRFDRNVVRGGFRFVRMDSIARIEPGFYPDLKREPFHNHARGGLSISMFGTLCNAASGWVAVDAVRYGSDGALESLDLRFEQRCRSWDPALHGAVHWQRPA